MACPNCNKASCNHTPAQRGQSEREVRADRKYGLDPEEGKVPMRELRERAWDAVAEFGAAGLSTAVELVGKTLADKYLASVRAKRREKERKRRKKRKKIG